MNQDPFTRTEPQPGRPHSETQPIGESEGTQQLHEAKNAAGDQVRRTASDLKLGASEAMESAKGASSHFVHDQKEKLAATLEEYTTAVEAACDKLEGGAGDRLAKPAHKATEQMQRAVDYLRSHEATDFLHDISDLARRRPELVFGTMFVAGLASVRFLKASAKDRSRQRRSGEFQPQGSGQPLPAGSYAPQPEPRPELAPIQPPTALETTNNPLTSDEW